ncbi:hypothetical protein SAMN04515671_4572 [Nakamurella panacisegetis]|uniref:Uncharacterized protein n=1 Tax=Nakamurella panacisegetis TaxID=1090615 RepID=A0A1H0TBC8_9ACTN|nr:hypothetical protein [Nakamurella panacisegetis]SDO16650.1 hypothetical protein SAMN04515671_0010 [Nakamurella panacisegetis]SDP51111.1 hypothetical protein SAMN04515671_4572 [Nakamurella panacisegetis]
MNAPEDDRRDTPASWGDYSSEDTQIVHPGAGGSDRSAVGPDAQAEPFSHPTSAANPPVDDRTQVVTPVSGDDPAWKPSYTPASDYSSQPTMTSVFPPSTPGYAPAGHPAAYAPPAQVAAPTTSTPEAVPSSRVRPAFLTALIGLVLSAGGVYLGVKYGIAAAADRGANLSVLKHASMAAAGAVLLFAALALNGWSPWATVIPGIGLTGIGGWTLFSASGLAHVNNWTKWAFSGQQFNAWNVAGFTLIVGVMMLAASVAATLARASGKRDGHIIGSRRLS